MVEFNRMTIAAAAAVISDFRSHSEMELLEVQWGVYGRCNSSSKPGRAAALANIAIEEDIQVLTERGQISLARSVVETAIGAPPHKRNTPQWIKLIAGLRFDGFEVIGLDPDDRTDENTDHARLARMLPSDIPHLDFREAQSEVELLLQRHRFSVPLGHLRRAIDAFQHGNWSSSNGELRNFFEGYLSEIADRLGYEGGGDARGRRDFLGSGSNPPFLFADYNEWHANNQKPQYIQGLLSRMHPHGGHPGLSEEEDATFRLQITLITARLFLRRFDLRN